MHSARWQYRRILKFILNGCAETSEIMQQNQMLQISSAGPVTTPVANTTAKQTKQKNRVGLPKLQPPKPNPNQDQPAAEACQECYAELSAWRRETAVTRSTHALEWPPSQRSKTLHYLAAPRKTQILNPRNPKIQRLVQHQFREAGIS